MPDYSKDADGCGDSSCREGVILLYTVEATKDEALTVRRPRRTELVGIFLFLLGIFLVSAYAFSVPSLDVEAVLYSGVLLLITGGWLAFLQLRTRIEKTESKIVVKRGRRQLVLEKSSAKVICTKAEEPWIVGSKLALTSGRDCFIVYRIPNLLHSQVKRDAKAMASALSIPLVEDVVWNGFLGAVGSTVTLGRPKKKKRKMRSRKDQPPLSRP